MDSCSLCRNFACRSPLAGHLGRRQFKRVTIRHAPDPWEYVSLGREQVSSAAHEARTAAEQSAYLLEPFYSQITGSVENWQTDADVGIVPEHRTIVTATGRGRKQIVSIYKIWPWSPAFASGAIVMHDVLVSIDGVPVEELELADVRAMLRGEEGSTVVLEILHLQKGLDFEPDRVMQQYVELERTVDYLRRDPIRAIADRAPWPDPHKYQDRAFFCLSLQSRLRRACVYLLESPRSRGLGVGV